MEENFVPSYKNDEERQKERKIKNRKYKIKMIIIIITSILAILGIVYLSYTLISSKYSKYEHFEEKMDIYGFSQVYDNGSAKTSEKVTKSEAIKMILSCLYNVPKIEGIALPTEETYSNAIWVEYAKKQGIILEGEITPSNADDKVKYQEVLVWLYNVKAKILNIEPDTSANFEVKDINAYNTDQKLAIYDLLNSGIIVTNTSKIDGNKTLYKGKLNELIINFAEEYNTITVGDARININEEKIPSNSNMYPYTLASVEKSIYEIGFEGSTNDDFILPVDYYKDNKQYYGQIKSYVENYYNYILSVDYNNISIEQMKRKLKKYAFEEFDEKILQKYVEYVKTNHIKLKGKATAQLPCIYFDGNDYRVRLKLELVIESSDTNKNILFYDLEGEEITYDGDEITLYIDSKLNKNGVSETLFVKEASIYSLLIKPTSSISSGVK